MSKKEKVKKPPTTEKMTREELLGFGTDIFSLNKAEYVAKKIIDEILYYTFEKIRINNVKNMDIEYSVYRNFKNLQMIVNLGLIKAEEEVEIKLNNNFTFDVNPCKIDAWASGRAKIIASQQPKEPLIIPNPNINKNYDSLKNKKREKNIDKSKEKDETHKSKKISDTKKIIKEPPPKELPMQCKPLPEEQREHWNEIEQMKLKGYRAYFQEKQIETQKRKQLEKEQAERAKEEEKKLKQVMELMNTGKLVSWDANGTFLPIKVLKENELKGPPIPKQKVKDSQTIFDTDKIFDLDKEGKQKKKKIVEIAKEEIPIIQKTVNYYQPNPLISHNIGKGVVMEFYGHKKTGGKYITGGDRLTMEQYHKLLDQIHPYADINMIEEKENESNENTENKNENEENNVEKNVNNDNNNNKEENLKSISKGKSSKKGGTKRLFYLFRDDIIKVDNEDKSKKKNQENILKTKKKKIESDNIKVSKDKIEYSKFKFQDIKNNQDKTIYNEMRQNIEDNFIDFSEEKPKVMQMPEFARTQNEFNKRTREKKLLKETSGVTIQEKLPKNILQALTKIKEESEQQDKDKGKTAKTVLPPISNRPKSSAVFKKAAKTKK